MLELKLVTEEGWDSDKEVFLPGEEHTLKFEHSLVAISKWESKYEKPFLNTDDKDLTQIKFYLGCMLLDPEQAYLLDRLTKSHMDELQAYITSKQTATWFSKTDAGHSSEVITSELIYYWMIAHNIPVEFEHWHINRLLTLIRVCGEKNQPPKKRSASEIAAERRALNEQRRRQANTNG